MFIASCICHETQIRLRPTGQPAGATWLDWLCAGVKSGVHAFFVVLTSGLYGRQTDGTYFSRDAMAYAELKDESLYTA